MFRAPRTIARALLILSFLSSTGRSFAQLGQCFREGDEFSFIYAKEDGTAVTVEASANLVDWSEAVSRETLLASEPGVQLIKSSIPTGDQAVMFLRLRVDSAWRVDVVWDGVEDPSVVGYRLYYTEDGEREARQLDVGYRTDAVLFLPENGRGYTFVVTCYNLFGLESEPSAEVRVLPGGLMLGGAVASSGG